MKRDLVPAHPGVKKGKPRTAAARLVAEAARRQWRKTFQQLSQLGWAQLRARHAEAARELARLYRLRGASHRTWQRMGWATAVLVAGGVLLSAGRATAQPVLPQFRNPFDPIPGIRDVGAQAAPEVADLDGDGDLDVLIGNADGDLLFFQNTGSATAPAFAVPRTNPFGLSNVGRYSRPELADLDGDGDLDALVGNYEGNILFFENTGSSTAAAFAPALTNPFGLSGVGRYSRPELADVDGDGDLDAFLGDYGAAILFFENTGSTAAPAFAAPLTNPFGLSPVLWFTTPELADLDGDGDLDALVGNREETILFFENTGSSTAPAFAPALTNPFGLSGLGPFGLYGRPELADLDGDGDLDALIGPGDGSLLFLENTGSATAPAFARPSSAPFGLSIGGPGVLRPALADLDGDGDLDVLVGKSDGYFFFFENTGSAAAPAFVLRPLGTFGLTRDGEQNRPALADLDGDGDVDVLTGSWSHFDFFENTGSATAPAFAAEVFEPFGLFPPTSFVTPALGDLDGDGDLDVLSGGTKIISLSRKGKFFFFENTGSAATPGFAPAVVHPFGLSGGQPFVDPALADLDGDGDLDLLAADQGCLVSFFENTGTAAAPAFAPPIADAFGLSASPRLSRESVAVGDLDGDGDPDLIVANRGGTFSFWENVGFRCMLQARCKSPSKSTLRIFNFPDDAADKVTFRWKGGVSEVADFGDPIQLWGWHTDYRLCIFDGNGAVVLMARAPAASTCLRAQCWRLKGSRSAPTGVRYLDHSKPPSHSGVRAVLGSVSPRKGTRVAFRLKGRNIPFLDMAAPLVMPVTVQVTTSNTGACWEAVFTAADTQRNDGQQYKAKLR